MNSHLLASISSEKNIHAVRSVEFFVAAIVTISVLGLIFFAAV